MKTFTKLWIGLAILIVISPIGLILPERIKSGAAWGEWGSVELRKLVGYIPQGLEKLGSLWSAPIPNYAFKGWDGKSLPQLSIEYIASAALGIAIVVAIAMFLGKLLVKK